MVKKKNYVPIIVIYIMIRISPNTHECNLKVKVHKREDQIIVVKWNPMIVCVNNQKTSPFNPRQCLSIYILVFIQF